MPSRGYKVQGGTPEVQGAEALQLAYTRPNCPRTDPY